MGVCNYVIRRRATYAWRRRLPGGGAVQVSLRSACPWTARRVGGIVTAESNEVFDRMAVDGLTVAQAKLWLDHVVQRELAKIAKLDAVFANDETPGRSRVERRNHLVHGHALQILAQDGLGAVAGDHEAALAGAGLNEHERAGVARDMDQIRDQLEVTERGLQRDLRTVTGLEDVEPLAWMQARQLYLRGRAAAYLAQDQVATQTRENDAERVLALAKMPSAAEGSLGPGRGGPAPSPSSGSRPDPLADPEGPQGSFSEPKDTGSSATRETEPVIRPVPAAPLAPASSSAPDSPDPDSGFDATLPVVAERLIRRKLRAGMQEKEAVQLRKLAALFTEATGVSDVTRLRQADCARFREVLAEIPADYRKSPREQAMTIPEILASAKDNPERRIGLSPATVNRTLGHLGQLLAQARAEGLPVAPIDLTMLRERDRVRARDKRLSFSPDEVRRIFAAPVWQGCHSEGRRRVPGSVIIRDPLYWLPLIAAYTGARREEIAGLEVKDLRQEDGIWLFDIRENANRGLKNATSRRTVPVHPHLMELGLLDQRERVGSGNLFPDLRRKAKLANLGDSIDHRWRNVLDDQLGDARQGKSFHSLRHYVTDQLRRAGVEKWVRLDLLGHAGEDIEDEVYGEAAPLAIKLAALERLPRVM
ncbi:tyrosine-type recombinase/integrase [Paracoccus panacisoli]|uniref:Tyrosine-type recombinase/integrase n=1 Tax=Paracoccus panacisoli TaxID=1510163 RepID=A0ABV6T7Y7_9RHOB